MGCLLKAVHAVLLGCSDHVGWPSLRSDGLARARCPREVIEGGEGWNVKVVGGLEVVERDTE